MKKKGFTLTEIIITITIIGILSLLGLNYVKRNVSRYDPLFYYRAYDALTKGFADAVANDVPLTGVGLCNHLLTIWNIDAAHSYCNSPEVAMINPSETGFFNHIAKAGSYIFNNLFMTPAYAYLNWGDVAGKSGYAERWHNGEFHFDIDGPCEQGYVVSDNGSCIPLNPPEDCNLPYQYYDWSQSRCRLYCSCSSYLYYRDHGMIEFFHSPTQCPDNGGYVTCDPAMPCWNTSEGCPDDYPPPTKVGSILAQNGLMFDFYSDTTFTAYEDEEDPENTLELTYSVIIVSKPNNNNITPIYFLVYPEKKELFPISPEIIDDKNLLPTYLTSDMYNRQNGPVTKYVSYRTARCEKETKVPNSSSYILPHSHMAYTHFVTMNNLLSMYSQNYCSETEYLDWLVPAARNAPRASMELKTSPPNGMR